MEVDISGAKVFFTTPIDVPLLGELQISETLIVSWIVMALITLGGIGFSVMFDVQKSQGRFSRLTLHSKLVLVISAILTVSGAVLFFLFEHDNPLTLADPTLHPGVRPVAALFQSVTTGLPDHRSGKPDPAVADADADLDVYRRIARIYRRRPQDHDLWDLFPAHR